MCPLFVGCAQERRLHSCSINRVYLQLSSPLGRRGSFLLGFSVDTEIGIFNEERAPIVRRTPFCLTRRLQR